MYLLIVVIVSLLAVSTEHFRNHLDFFLGFFLFSLIKKCKKNVCVRIVSTTVIKLCCLSQFLSVKLLYISEV